MKPLIFGLLSSIAILSVFFLTMSLLTGSLEASFEQFNALKYYMIPLSIGFGIQVGLYTNLHQIIKKSGSSHLMTANTATSTIAMIACCAHHATDFLPLIGLTFLTYFLVQY